jgi:hypothetical protein
MTVTTAILESRHFTTGAKENDRPIEQGPRDGFVLELPGEPRDVPAIEWKHAGSIARVGIATISSDGLYRINHATAVLSREQAPHI